MAPGCSRRGRSSCRTWCWSATRTPSRRQARGVRARSRTPTCSPPPQLPPFNPPKGDLWWVDVDTGMAAALQRANGSENGTVYLPYGAAEAAQELRAHRQPGRCRRLLLGLLHEQAQLRQLFRDPPEVFDDASAKKIWVAAIDIEGAPGSDPSHPAFYLPNQELESGNIRAFAALEPCRDEGASCDSGVDCCCGYCIKRPGGCRRRVRLRAAALLRSTRSARPQPTAAPRAQPASAASASSS